MSRCPYCPRPKAHRKDAQTCGASLCRAERNRELSAAKWRATHQPCSPRSAPVPAGGEPAAHVDRLLAAAERRRKRYERTIGRRIFTITDGWSQKPGRSTIDGEMRACEVAE
jgi:hypothetical protein